MSILLGLFYFYIWGYGTDVTKICGTDVTGRNTIFNTCSLYSQRSTNSFVCFINIIWKTKNQHHDNAPVLNKNSHKGYGTDVTGQDGQLIDQDRSTSFLGMTLTFLIIFIWLLVLAIYSFQWNDHLLKYVNIYVTFKCLSAYVPFRMRFCYKGCSKK